MKIILGVLNKKISTKVGIVVLISVAVFAGWIIIREYKKLIEMRFAPLEVMGQSYKKEASEKNGL